MSQTYLLTPDNAALSRHPVAATNKATTISGKDALAGAAGGVVSVLLGQPFDLIKVRLQTSDSGNVWQVVKGIWLHEGPLAFYKGAALPFLGVGASVSIQFMTFHSLRQYFERQQHSQRASTGQNYLSGGAAGIANSIISGPVEHIRTRLQLQPHGVARLYSGPSDCVRQIFAKAGVAGIFKAYPTTVLREFQAYGFYFAAFEASLGSIASLKGKERKDIAVWETIPCGALAGIAFWIGSYPIDAVKTRLQSDGFGADARYRTTWAVVKEIWQYGGFRGFWRGLAPTLVRTSLSSAGCFAVIEHLRKLM
ncbi:hypothetical protein W97_01822 [Coniosporium apollinis CBS 100218]|uniref:Solute carrier family 25, member 46 n=1 Tax=Coniosporium apollinis (strain CBS 100218) TaxID=1168221 RepID=R7YL61_CONA1|nr:uncharacterized protein W97_01822 [Coniosporium apollinis CBS 100218]EON62598.1 hypothetical protein W97_01822 [Coniosporium apollinis CBS 100218]